MGITSKKYAYFEDEGSMKRKKLDLPEIANTETLEINNKCNMLEDINSTAIDLPKSKYLSNLGVLEKYAGTMINIRQNLLGSCAKTVLYSLYLYKNRIKTLFEDDEFNGYIVIPIQTLFKNKLASKRIFYGGPLNHYLAGISILGTFSLKVDASNIEQVYPVMSTEMRKMTGIDKLYEEFLNGRRDFSQSFFGNIFSLVTYREETKELVIKFNKEAIDLVVNPLGGFSSYIREDISKLNNLFSVKLYLELVKKYKLTKGIYTIKFKNIKDIFNINLIGKRKLSLSEKKRDFTKFYLKPFIEKVNEQTKLLKISDYSYDTNNKGELVLTIIYTVNTDFLKKEDKTVQEIAISNGLDINQIRDILNKFTNFSEEEINNVFSILQENKRGIAYLKEWVNIVKTNPDIKNPKAYLLRVLEKNAEPTKVKQKSVVMKATSLADIGIEI